MSYSQNKEEEIILEYFGEGYGTLLSIGENDGETLSNTRALILNGWSGLLIEASPKAYRRLDQLYINHYPFIQTMCCVVAAKDGEILLYESGEHLGKGDVGLLSTTKPEEMKRWEVKDLAVASMGKRGREYKSVTKSSVDFHERIVPCLTFDSVMKRSQFQTFDFITIDIEGTELEVLPQMNFDRLGTKMVCVEFNGKNEEKFTEIMKGFKLIHKNAENLIYVRT